MKMVSNKFCSLDDLTNESSVETFFVNRLIKDLGYPDSSIKLKTAITQLIIGKGSSKEHYKPDYVLHHTNTPRFIIDAKASNENPKDYHYQVSGYALRLNQKLKDNSVQYVAVTNGHLFVLYRWDNETPLLKLSFTDFTDKNKKFQELLGYLSHKNIKIETSSKEKSKADDFEFKRADSKTLDKIFITCHNTIWKKDKKKPVEAFHEFVKIFFIKIWSDKKIHKIIKDGKTPSQKDYLFSTHYMNELYKTNPNPINFLFDTIRNEMEDEIDEKKKKRIFDKDDKIMIKPSTIIEVVKILEHLDLSGIDEDLNGRMFEHFLNATIRGKDLGQFFTPRSVVKFMVKMASIKISSNMDESHKVIDACCGSGGFLVEIMADMWEKIQKMNGLTDVERITLKCDLIGNNIFGIDADKKISRIARMNMYLHGDGSNKTYWLPDSLDKEIHIENGIEEEMKKEAEELKNSIKDGLKFDIAITNPPFAMKYKKTEADDQKKMEQYSIAKEMKSSNLRTSIKSNVLFVERYHDLLKDDGLLLTVVDDSVLNGTKDSDFRIWIMERFVIKAVISLPFNTFKLAGSGVKTSILFLKKKSGGEQQSDMFMAIANNIGHDDYGRRTPKRDNLDDIFSAYQKFKDGEVIEPTIIHNEKETEKMSCPMQYFIVKSEKLEERIDAFYYCPELQNIQNSIKKALKHKKCELLDMEKIKVVKNITNQDVEQLKESESVFKYVEVGDVTTKGEIERYQHDFIVNLPTRARKPIKENDVLISGIITSLGNNTIIQKEFDGHFASNGFIVIRADSIEQANKIWASTSHDSVLKQMYYTSTTAIQRCVSETLFKKKILVPISNDNKSLLNSITQYRNSRIQINKSLDEIKKNIDLIFD